MSVFVSGEYEKILTTVLQLNLCNNIEFCCFDFPWT